MVTFSAGTCTTVFVLFFAFGEDVEGAAGAEALEAAGAAGAAGAADGELPMVISTPSGETIYPFFVTLFRFLQFFLFALFLPLL
jgi:hypothetical protein